MKRFIVENSGEVHLIPYDDIDYIKQDMREVIVATKTGIYKYYGSIKDITYLPKQFLQPLSFSYVNIENITAMEKSEIKFANNSLKIGRDNFLKFRQLVLNKIREDEYSPIYCDNHYF